jgi:predicted MPP superfamily phosphohydrolase
VPRRFIFSILLGLLHFYIGAQILPDLPVGALLQGLGVAWLAASFLLIQAGLLARTIRRQPLSDRLAWAGLLTTGLFSSLLVLTFMRDMALLTGSLLGAHSAAITAWTAVAVPILAGLMTLLGLFNARRLARVVDVEVPIAGLPAALHGFTIVQISDIHVGPTIKRGYLDRIVDRVNELKPDLIAVTGDVVDGSVRELSVHTAPLARLYGKYGTYAVTGNHEYYSGAPPWIAELRRLGLRVLMNEHVLIEHDGEALLLAGVTDYSAHHFDESHRSDPHAALAGAKSTVGAKVLLAHQPRSAVAAADAGFDLQLSGHTHGGQFFPWNLFVSMQQPFTAGLNRLRSLWVYTSRGTGYWGPPKRFGAPSEITRVRLVKEAGGRQSHTLKVPRCFKAARAAPAR